MENLTKTQKEIMNALPLRLHSYNANKYGTKRVCCYINDSKQLFFKRSVDSLIKKGLIMSIKNNEGRTRIVESKQ